MGRAYISRCNNVIAVIAAEAGTLGKLAAHAVAHDKESVEAEGGIHDNLQRALQSAQALT